MNWLKFLANLGKTATDVSNAATTIGTVAAGVEAMKQPVATTGDTKKDEAKEKQAELNAVLNFLVATQPDDDAQFDADVLAMVTKYRHKNLCDFAIAAQRAVTKRDAAATTTATTTK